MRIENDPKAYGFLAGLLVLLLVTVANAGCVPVSAGRKPSIALEQAVKVTATCLDRVGNGAVFFGSGVIVDKNTVLTAGHVAADPEGYACIRTVTMMNDHVYVVMPGKIMRDRDLATLKLLFQDFDPTYPVIYGPPPAFGDRVCAMVSYPYWLYRCGEAQTFAEPPGDRVHTITVEPGNSGSGVYDSHGRLVGIITHRWSCFNGQLCGGKFSTLEGHVEELLRE